MSIHLETGTVDYEVVAESRVTVRVTIGEAQAGGWVIGWDSDHVIAKGSAPTDVDIGRGADLRGRTLQVAATAVDVRRETNRLSATLVVTGGVAGAQQFTTAWDDGGDGDVAVFTTLIGFR